MRKDMEENEFLDAKEMQAWIGISKPTLLAWLGRTNDPLPGVKIGGRWKFRRQAVLEWWMRQESGRAQINQATPRPRPASTGKTEKGQSPELESWLRIASKVMAEEAQRDDGGSQEKK